MNTYEHVLNVQRAGTQFRIETDRAAYFAKYVVVATGFYDNPNRMNIPGEDLPKVKHYFDEPHPYAYRKIAVIGGGNSAVDVALETFRRGAEVTMIIREGALDHGIKYWVKPDIENRIKEGTIKAHFNSMVREIQPTTIDVQTPAGLLTLENDFVFAMTGYQPDYHFLQQIGIEVSQDEKRVPGYDPETFESNQKGIFLAGVICGGMVTNRWTLENSRVHAIKIFEYLKSKSNAEEGEGELLSPGVETASGCPASNIKQFFS